eukprot:COSAG01_NODE_509_length_16084_cov_18.063180_12_plen_158_part_00
MLTLCCAAGCGRSTSFVLLLLYPLQLLEDSAGDDDGTNASASANQTGWSLSLADEVSAQSHTRIGTGVQSHHGCGCVPRQEVVGDLFGGVLSSLFTATNMLFFGSDPALRSLALSPSLATLHYLIYVMFVPLVMLNLVRAIQQPSLSRVCQMVSSLV